MKNKEFKVGVITFFILHYYICFAILFVICFSILIVIERRVRITKFEEVKISEQSRSKSWG